MAETARDTVEIRISEIFEDDAGGLEGEHIEAPWCVDDGQGIQVMSTEQIRAGLQAGTLSPELKAWRDGQACWLAIHEQPELVGSATPAPVVVELEEPSRLSETPLEVLAVAALGPAARPPRGIRSALVTAMLIGLAVGTLATAAYASETHRPLRARRLGIEVPAVAAGARCTRWRAPFGEPMSGFRR